MTRIASLRDIKPGQSALIQGIRGNSPFKKRLLEMGLVKGEVIQKLKLAPLADPAEYVVKGYHVSLRQEEAADILVEPVNRPGSSAVTESA